MNNQNTLYKHPGLESPPRDLWSEIESRLESEQEAEELRRNRRWPIYAAAASVLLTCLLTLAVLVVSPQDSHAAAVDRWQNYNDKLDQQIELLDNRPRVARGHQLVTLRRLNERLGQLETRLSIAGDSRIKLQLLQRRSATQIELINAHAYQRVVPFIENAKRVQNTRQNTSTEYYEL